jgi:hypothetical protein
MIREYEIQHSISYGVAKVLRSEVALAQNTLRSGQNRGVKFDVVQKPDVADNTTSDAPIDPDSAALPTASQTAKKGGPQAGHCVGCHEPFSEFEMETLVGFACGHVFHLSHLLSYNNEDDRPVTPPDIELDEDGTFATTHGVGAKVTHARLLRDKIKDGCPVCAAKT